MTEMKRFDVAGCSGYCNGGYHMKEDVDGEYVTYESHVEAMKRIAGASAQHAEPAVVRKTFVFDGVRNPDFVPLRIEFEPGYPEDVAFGTQRQMDRLKKWLDKFFAMRTAQSASPAALTDERIDQIARENNLDGSMLGAPRHEYWRAFARALLAASPADQVGWQPIETAPKDGTEILLFRGAEIFEGKPVAERVTSGAWIELIETASEYHATTGEYLGQSIQGGEASWMSWDGGFREDAPPTHWMPLPPAPVMSASKEGV